MKTIILICVLSLGLKAQDKVLGFDWNLTPQQDLTFDFYSNALLSYGTSKMVYKITKDSFWSGAAGIGVGFARCAFERGLSGKIVSGFGAVTGNFVFDFDMDNRRKREQQKLENQKYKCY